MHLELPSNKGAFEHSFGIEPRPIVVSLRSHMYFIHYIFCKTAKQINANPLLTFPQIGSKARLSPKIVEFLPQKFGTYVEPFVGTGSIYFRLMKEGVIPRDTSVILNDFGSEIANALTVACDRAEELCRAVELPPYAAGEVGQAVDTAADPVERARRFLAHAHLSFVGAEPLRRFSIGGSKKRPERWACVPDELRMLMEPLKRATVTRMDAIGCNEKFEGEDTLFIIDPLYIGREHFYRARFQRTKNLYASCPRSRLRALS